MTLVHQRLGIALVVIGLVGAVWALLGWRRGAPSPALRAYSRLVLGALIVQAVLGIALLVRGERPAQGIHLFYGPAVLLAMLAGIVLGAGDAPRREALVLTVGLFSVFLLGIRAVGTGA